MKIKSFRKLSTLALLCLIGCIIVDAQRVIKNKEAVPLKSGIEVKKFSKGLLKFLKGVKTQDDILPPRIERETGIKNFGYDGEKNNRYFSRTEIVGYKFWSVNATNRGEYFSEEDRSNYQLWFYFGYFRPVPEGRPSPTRPYPPPYISDETPGCKIDFLTFAKELKDVGFQLSEDITEVKTNSAKWHIYKREKTKIGIYVQMIPSKNSLNSQPLVTPGIGNQPTIIDFKTDNNAISTCIATVKVGTTK